MRLLPALLAGTLAGVACGPAADAPAEPARALVRPELVLPPERAAPPEPVRVLAVASFAELELHAGTVAPDGSVELPAESVLLARAPLPAGAPAPNVVTVRARVDRRVLASAELWVERRRLAKVAQHLEAESAAPLRLVLEEPLAPDARPTHVVLRLVNRGGARPARAELLELDARRVPPRRALPPAGRLELVDVDGDARRAGCLASGAPAEVRLAAAAGAELLRADVAVPVAVRRHGDALALVAELVVDGAPAARRRVELVPDGPGWSRVELPLGAAGEQARGRDVVARFALESALPGETYAALGEPWLLRREPDPPTVVLLVSDTHRADHLGAAPQETAVRTPFLDALAAEGVLFEDALASANSTSPSHAALFTGRPPRDTGIVSNDVRLSDAAVTLAERFREAGYATFAAVSARHLGADWSGLGQGFDRYAAPVEPQRDSSETIAQLERWLPDADGVPLFVFLHVFDAHQPYEPPAPWGPPDPPPTDGPRRAADDQVEALYRAEVAYLDDRLARLFAHPRLARATVAFTADHGEELRHGPFPFSHVGLRPATLHVPLVLRAPGLEPGRRVARPVRQIDVGRTLLDLAGLAEAEFPGRSLLDDDPAASAAPRYAIEAHGWSASVTLGRWMLVLRLRDHATEAGIRRRRHTASLHDVAADPALAVDLSDAEPERAARLRALLVRWLADARPEGWSEATGLDADLLARNLAALGYAGGDGPRGTDRWIAPDCRCGPCRGFDGR